jgi:hypothetical protein
MNDQFDELAKNMAQSVTRRGALKKFGLGLAGIALATLGLANKAEADPPIKLPYHCHCKKPNYGCDPNDANCLGGCATICGF